MTTYNGNPMSFRIEGKTVIISYHVINDRFDDLEINSEYVDFNDIDDFLLRSTAGHALGQYSEEKLKEIAEYLYYWVFSKGERKPDGQQLNLGFDFDISLPVTSKNTENLKSSKSDINSDNNDFLRSVNTALGVLERSKQKHFGISNLAFA